MARPKNTKPNLLPAVAFRFDSHLKNELLRLAKAEQRTLSNYIRIVLEKHVREVREDHKAQTQQPAAA
jgi:predicted DNA-binding protein